MEPLLYSLQLSIPQSRGFFHVRPLYGFEVKNVIEDKPDKLWDRVQSDAAITKKAFSDYYTNTEKGYGIVINKAWRLKQSVSLDNLKKKCLAFTHRKAIGISIMTTFNA